MAPTQSFSPSKLPVLAHLCSIFVSLLLLSINHVIADRPELDQRARRVFEDRLWQTNLRGPRWTGNDNQNILTESVASSMRIAGLTVDTLNYTIQRWDPRWWSLTLNLRNGTSIGLPTTGYWPYSGNSGLAGVTGPVVDAGTYGLKPDQSANVTTLNTSAINAPLVNSSTGAVMFFDNPSPTRNYLAPGYTLLGTGRNISLNEIPELGNLTNPHWQSEKELNFTSLRALGVSAVIASWVHTSDEDAALQYLPNDGAPGAFELYDVPALYVGNSTGEIIRTMTARGEVESATVVLDAPSVNSTSQTVLGHLQGTGGGNKTIILYTHSDGPSIIEENGPILLLSIAEYFAQHRPTINIDFVITTGHMSGGHLDETAWMDERPDLLRNAKAAVVCEHFGATEWKDAFVNGQPLYVPTGRLEPMWTMANDSSKSDILHDVYLDAFQDTDPALRMALLAPQTVNGKCSHWYGAGGSSNMGRSQLPTIGIIPQPDYLWAAMVDGGWSKLSIPTAIEQINIILRVLEGLDSRYVQSIL